MFHLFEKNTFIFCSFPFQLWEPKLKAPWKYKSYNTMNKKSLMLIIKNIIIN